MDEIKLCQEKDYSFEDLCHTISDHYLDNLSKISEEELGKNGSQSVVSKAGEMKTMCLPFPVQYVHLRGMGRGALSDSTTVRCQFPYCTFPDVLWGFTLSVCVGEGVL